jgi:hypothetical protein
MLLSSSWMMQACAASVTWLPKGAFACGSVEVYVFWVILRLRRKITQKSLSNGFSAFTFAAWPQK